MSELNIDKYPNYRTQFDADLLTFVEQFVFEDRKATLKKMINMRTQYLTFVAEQLLDEHNVYAIVRTSECYGLQDFYNIPFDKALKKNRTITRGAFNWSHIYNYPQPETTVDCIKDLKSKGYRVYTTSSHFDSAILPHEVPLDKPIAVVLGNEHRGASEEAIALADGFLKIPMYGFTESYNVSVAAALIGLPIIQKIRESEVSWGLNEIQKRDLYFEWIWHSIKNPDKVYAEWKNNR